MYKGPHLRNFFLTGKRIFWGGVGDRMWYHCLGDVTLMDTAYEGIIIDKYGKVVLVKEK